MTVPELSEAGAQALLRAFGTTEPDLALVLGKQLLAAVPKRPGREAHVGLLASLGLKPKDAIESMIAIQFTAAHFAAMDEFATAASEETPGDPRSAALQRAADLTRSCANLLRALNGRRELRIAELIDEASAS